MTYAASSSHYLTLPFTAKPASPLLSPAIPSLIAQQKADHRAHTSQPLLSPSTLTLTLRTLVAGRLTCQPASPCPALHRDFARSLPFSLAHRFACWLACWLPRSCLPCLPALPRRCRPPPVSSQSPHADCHPTLTLSTTSHHHHHSLPPRHQHHPPPHHHTPVPSPPGHSHTRLRVHRKASAPLLSTPSG